MILRALQSLLVLLSFTIPATAHPAVDEMAATATAFLDALTSEQRTAARIAFTDAERENWHYVPMKRAGIPLKAMNAEQRTLALDLLRSALSTRGYDKVSQIINLETVLAEIEGPGASARRDPGLYYLLIAGAPEAHGTWGWRFEGHHISLNITVVDGEAVAQTPSFLGANPAEVRQGPHRGQRVLADEEDGARAFMKSLTSSQRQQAVISKDAPFEILTAAERRVSALAPAGVAASTLDASQQMALMRLISTYLDRHRPELAAADLEKIRSAGLAAIRFAWAGSLARGEAHYYRIQGPTFLLEYDSTQNGANHIHTVWRDFDGDFGRDLLLEHRKADHSEPDGNDKP